MSDYGKSTSTKEGFYRRGGVVDNEENSGKERDECAKTWVNSSWKNTSKMMPELRMESQRP